MLKSEGKINDLVISHFEAHFLIVGLGVAQGGVRNVRLIFRSGWGKVSLKKEVLAPSPR